MINHGNRGVPSFRIQISPFSYECPVSCPSTVHESPKLELHHNDNQSYNVWHNYLSCHPFSSVKNQLQIFVLIGTDIGIEIPLK